MRAALAIALVACYAPHAQQGSPCSDGPCPPGLVCSPATLTCEVTAIEPDAPSGGEPAPPAAPANDLPGGAIDVTAGGTFTADLAGAHDDAPQVGCSGDGGLDVYYSVTLARPQVYYFDTFGSSFATIVRAFGGVDCADAGAMPSACSELACSGTASQLAISLPAGTSCIIVDQRAGEPTSELALEVAPGGRDGLPLAPGVQTTTGSSCSGRNAAQPSNSCVSGDSRTAQDVGYFFTACPGQTLALDASTCVDPTVTDYDTVIYLRQQGVAGTLACNDDSATCMPRPDRPDHADGSVITNVAATGPGLFWLTIDGYNGACGPYQLDTDLR
ncbi:MAG TPA: hypothetical protein VLX92_04785 [Kofleriaceae bacterium]|nr:hypothetical protein [Kofleriaceae bacterium]